jgi:hypothetical protein
MALTCEATIEDLSPRELVLLNEIFRIEGELRRYAKLASPVERESYDLIVDQLQLVISRLSSEDDLLLAHVGRVSMWLQEHIDRLASLPAIFRTGSHEPRLEY